MIQAFVGWSRRAWVEAHGEGTDPRIPSAVEVCDMLAEQGLPTQYPVLDWELLSDGSVRLDLGEVTSGGVGIYVFSNARGVKVHGFLSRSEDAEGVYAAVRSVWSDIAALLASGAWDFETGERR